MPARKRDLKLKQATLCVNPSSLSFAVPLNRSLSGGARADPAGSTSIPQTTLTQVSSNENDTPRVSSRGSIENHVNESGDEREAFTIRSNDISSNNEDEDQATPPPTRNLGHLRRRKSLKVQSLSDTDELEGPLRKKARLRRGKLSNEGISSDEDVAQLANEVDQDRMLILSL